MFALITPLFYEFGDQPTLQHIAMALPAGEAVFPAWPILASALPRIPLVQGDLPTIHDYG